MTNKKPDTQEVKLKNKIKRGKNKQSIAQKAKFETDYMMRELEKATNKPDELLSCRFCGEKDKLSTELYDDDNNTLVTCQTCESEAWLDVWNKPTSTSNSELLKEIKKELKRLAPDNVEPNIYTTLDLLQRCKQALTDSKDGWQPYSTIPKDGSVIWVWAVKHGVGQDVYGEAHEYHHEKLSRMFFNPDEGWCHEDLDGHTFQDDYLPEFWQALNEPQSPIKK